jgi:ribonuclease P protein component
MREAVRLQCDMVASGWDVVLIARKGLTQADYWATERSLTHLLEQAQLLRTAEGAEQAPEQHLG